MQGSARVNQRSNSLEMPCNHQIWQKEPPDQSVMHQWVKGHAGVSWGQPEGNCLEMRKPSNVANATEHYAAAGALVYINKFAMFVCFAMRSAVLRPTELKLGTGAGFGKLGEPRNALWLPNLVSRTPDHSVVHCWGQRSCRGHPGSAWGQIT